MDQHEWNRDTRAENQMCFWQEDKINYCLFVSNSLPKQEGPNLKRAFGILVHCRGCCIRSVQNITEDEEKLRELVLLCNRGQLSLCHLDEVIEDFLN